VIMYLNEREDNGVRFFTGLLWALGITAVLFLAGGLVIIGWGYLG
jgi:hypothetical protein